MVCKNYARELRHLDSEMGCACLFVRKTEQGERCAFFCLPNAFHGGDFCRLILKRYKPMQVAHKNLNGGNNGGKHDSGSQHFPCGGAINILASTPGTYSCYEKSRGEERGGHCVNEPILERRIEYYFHPVVDHKHAILDRKARRRMHP